MLGRKNSSSDETYIIDDFKVLKNQKFLQRLINGSVFVFILFGAIFGYTSLVSDDSENVTYEDDNEYITERVFMENFLNYYFSSEKTEEMINYLDNHSVNTLNKFNCLEKCIVQEVKIESIVSDNRIEENELISTGSLKINDIFYEFEVISKADKLIIKTISLFEIEKINYLEEDLSNDISSQFIDLEPVTNEELSQALELLKIFFNTYNSDFENSKYLYSGISKLHNGVYYDVATLNVEESGKDANGVKLLIAIEEHVENIGSFKVNMLIEIDLSKNKIIKIEIN